MNAEEQAVKRFFHDGAQSGVANIIRGDEIGFVIEVAMMSLLLYAKDCPEFFARLTDIFFQSHEVHEPFCPGDDDMALSRLMIKEIAASYKLVPHE